MSPVDKESQTRKCLIRWVEGKESPVDRCHLLQLLTTPVTHDVAPRDEAVVPVSILCLPATEDLEIYTVKSLSLIVKVPAEF